MQESAGPAPFHGEVPAVTITEGSAEGIEQETGAESKGKLGPKKSKQKRSSLSPHIPSMALAEVVTQHEELINWW